MGQETHRHHDDEHDRGLQYDVTSLLRRRRVLGLLAGAGLAAVAGCAPDRVASRTSPTSGAPDATAAASGSAATTAATCTTEIPEETSGPYPYPGDGSNGPKALAQSGIVRGDIRSSYGSASGVAGGVPLSVNLAVLDLAKGCTGYRRATIYLWHCDRAGRYSMYDREIANENYLRGVQEADAAATVTFTTIFPGAYAGRWPHIHFEVYPTLASATSAGNKITTSQLALPEAVCRAAYATVTGDVSTGFVANLSVPVRG